MISAFFGVPGVGKSLALAWVAKQAVLGKPVRICGRLICEQHKRVFANFDCPGCYKFDFSMLGVYDFRDCVILIDEIMMYADARDFKRFSEDLKFFFSQHRKFNVDVVWTSQSYDDSDKKIRNLTANYFLIDYSRLPNCSKFVYIEPFFDIVDFTPRSGYAFGSSQRYYLPTLYKYVDSYQTISREKDSLKPVPLELYSDFPLELKDKLRIQLFLLISMLKRTVKKGKKRREEQEKLMQMCLCRW
ncbi:MAG: ATPase [Inoviridae sp.]|nr:MAG: ATPase [Inoviridae sp.]